MTWLIVGLVAWFVIAIPAALLIGRAVRVADARRASAGELDVQADARRGPENFVVPQSPLAVDPQPWTGPPTVPSPAPQRRRWPVVRAPVTRAERTPSHRDSGVR